MKPHAINDGLDALDAHPLIARAVAASLDVAAVGVRGLAFGLRGVQLGARVAASVGRAIVRTLRRG